MAYQQGVERKQMTDIYIIVILTLLAALCAFCWLMWNREYNRRLEAEKALQTALRLNDTLIEKAYRAKDDDSILEAEILEKKR